MSNRDGPSGKAIGTIIIIVAIVAVSFLTVGWHTVNAGYRGVKLDFGKPVDIVDEGWVWLIPNYRFSVIDIPVQTMKFEDDADAASSDIQDVKAKIAINYHLDPTKVLEIYSTLNVFWEDRVIRPNLQEVVKANTALYTAQELITQRPKVQAGITATYVERLKTYGVIVEAINIVDFRFSEAYTKAIENKVVAEQEALRETNVLERIRVQALQRVTEAKGIALSDIERANGTAIAKVLQAQADARTLELLNEQLAKGQVVLQFRAIDKWDGKMPFVMSGGGNLPFILDISNINATKTQVPQAGK